MFDSALPTSKLKYQKGFCGSGWIPPFAKATAGQANLPNFVGLEGVEPSLVLYKSTVLPLNYKPLKTLADKSSSSLCSGRHFASQKKSRALTVACLAET